jgi:exonuclease VII small subunit
MSAENKTIQEQMVELNEIVSWFNGEQFDIALAKQKYKEAVKLSDAIEKELTATKNEIEVLKKDFGD